MALRSDAYDWRSESNKRSNTSTLSASMSCLKLSCESGSRTSDFCECLWAQVHFEHCPQLKIFMTNTTYKKNSSHLLWTGEINSDQDTVFLLSTPISDGELSTKQTLSADGSLFLPRQLIQFLETIFCLLGIKHVTPLGFPQQFET